MKDLRKVLSTVQKHMDYSYRGKQTLECLINREE